MPLARLPAPLLLGRTVTDSEVLESIPISKNCVRLQVLCIACNTQTGQEVFTGIND